MNKKSIIITECKCSKRRNVQHFDHFSGETKKDPKNRIVNSEKNKILSRQISAELKCEKFNWEMPLGSEKMEGDLFRLKVQVFSSMKGN